MYVNERDQINYHGFLRALREMNHVSQECVSKGICTVSGMNRFENGNRLAEKLMRDRLTSRLGISGEKYEDYLQPKEYVRWEHRLRIIKAIEKRDLKTAKKELESYVDVPELNRINAQFVDAMHYMILCLEKASDEEQLECIQTAVKRTVSNVKKAVAGAHLLADQEINLIAEKMRLTPAKKAIRDEKRWRISEYETLISYIEGSYWEKLQKAKVYPKITYYICQLLLEQDSTEEELRRGLELCHVSMELLRDTSRLYYFIELTETRRALAERLLAYGLEEEEHHQLVEMLAENNEWESVWKALYEEHKVNAYMSDFCYLYYETECHNMVKVIEARRKMLGLSRLKLSEGVCSDRTIIRFEREGRNPSIDIVRLLFEKMGLCAEYRRARVITNDVEALMLSIELADNINGYELSAWEANLKKLEKRLNMNILLNQQQIMGMRSLLEVLRKDITPEEYHDKNIKAFECSLSLKTLDTKKKTYYTREELSWIYNQAFVSEGTITKNCIKTIEKACENIAEIGPAEFCVYELLVEGYVSYLGNKGLFEKSMELGYYMLKECLSNRRMVMISSYLYNYVWNYQQQCEMSNSTIDIEKIVNLLRKCITICQMLRDTNWESFFQQKYKEFV